MDYPKTEEVGFEPTDGGYPSPVFKTGAIDRSATPPEGVWALIVSEPFCRVKTLVSLGKGGSGQLVQDVYCVRPIRGMWRLLCYPLLPMG